MEYVTTIAKSDREKAEEAFAVGCSFLLGLLVGGVLVAAYIYISAKWL